MARTARAIGLDGARAAGIADTATPTAGTIGRSIRNARRTVAGSARAARSITVAAMPSMDAGAGEAVAAGDE